MPTPSVERGEATIKRRLTLGDLDLCSIDTFDRDAEYIYDEVFRDQVYAHPRFALGDQAIFVDVGANIGLSAIWTARTYRPRRILAYEASPTTFEYLAENLTRHIDPAVSRVECFNAAVSREADRVLDLHQPLYTSGLSTLLDASRLDWLAELRAKGELHTHRVRTTTLSREMELRGLERIDLLKIDVEGHFMEVLGGIDARDYARIRNIVLEAEYMEEVGHTADSVCGALRDRGYDVEAMGPMIYAWRA